MTKEELATIFESVQTEMLQNGFGDRLQASLDDVSAKYGNGASAVELIPLALHAMMDYNRDFMFRVLSKALITD